MWVMFVYRYVRAMFFYGPVRAVFLSWCIQAVFVSGRVRAVSHTNCPDVNSAWEFFDRNMLSLMYRLIPFHLQLSYPSSHPWYTESCGESVALKELAFSSWKAN